MKNKYKSLIKSMGKDKPTMKTKERDFYEFEMDAIKRKIRQNNKFIRAYEKSKGIPISKSKITKI